MISIPLSCLLAQNKTCSTFKGQIKEKYPVLHLKEKFLGLCCFSVWFPFIIPGKKLLYIDNFVKCLFLKQMNHILMMTYTNFSHSFN